MSYLTVRTIWAVWSRQPLRAKVGEMTDRKALVDPNETPEDVATLYSWANLHGAKYRDFSASRAQTREKARQRVQEAIESERRRSRDEADAQNNAEVLRSSEAARLAESERQAEILARDNAMRADRQAAEMAAQQAQQEAARAAQQRAWQTAPAYEPAAAYPGPAPSYVPPAPSYTNPAPSYTAPAARPSAPSYMSQQPVSHMQPPTPSYMNQHPAQTAPQPTNQVSSYPAQPTYQAQSAYQSQLPYAAPQNNAAPVQQSYPAPAPPQAYPPASQPVTPPAPELQLQHRNPWAPPETKDAAVRPAWLSSSDRADVPPPAQQMPQPPVDDTLQGSRDRITSRWFALKGVFSNAPAQLEAPPAPSASRAPVLAVFSLAGGVGKTSLVATLGRALSARGERVLLVDTAAFGLLPFFFGARDQRPGVLRTFTAPGVSGDAPIQMLTIDPESIGPENQQQEALTQEITRNSSSASRILVDLATASGATTRRLLRMSPTVLVPVIPDMSSVVSVSSIDSFFRHNPAGSGQSVMPFYIFNQFDPSLPLHLDVREVLREQLGDRLLPFALRRTPAVSEALAEGMTVVDYAPNSSVAEDFGALAAWVKSLAAPATNGFRGVRWSER